MRTDIPDSTHLLFSRDGFIGEYKVEIQQSRQTVLEAEFNTTRQVSFADDPGYSATVVPQDAKLIDNRMTVVYSDEGTIKLQDVLRAVITPTYSGASLQTDPYSRPTIVDYDDISFYIYYIDTASQIYRATINKPLFSGSNVACVTAVDSIGVALEVASVALHATGGSGSEGEYLVAAWIDDGGVRARVYDGSTYYESQGRIIHPIEVYEADVEADCRLLNYSAAVLFGDFIFFYLSTPDGNVTGLRFDTQSLMWGDTFEAVAADLSRFSIANAEVFHDKVVMAGQFTREDPVGAFSSTYVYNLILSSTDGKVFTLDRNTMVTYGDDDDDEIGAMRFFACGVDRPNIEYGVPGPAIMLQSFGIWASVRAPYTIVSGQVKYETTNIFSITGSPNEGWTLACGFIDQEILDDIRLGDSVNIYMSPVRADGSREWFLLQEAVLSRKGRSYEDGKISTNLVVESFSLGHLNDMAWPFYVELQGKQSIRDDMDDFSNMYKASEEGYMIAPFMVDFWSKETCGPVATAPGGETETWTSDLKSAYGLVDYPEIMELPFNVACYGWSRPGKTTNLETGGDDIPTPPDALAAWPYVKITINRDGEEFTYDVDEGDFDPDNWFDPDIATGHFSQSWYENIQPGDYPVVLQANTDQGLAVGDKIVKIAMVFVSDDTDCLSYPERIEIPSIGMHIATFAETWKEVEETDYVEDGNLFILEGTTVSGGGSGGCTLACRQIDGGQIEFVQTFPYADWKNLCAQANIRLDPVPPSWGDGTAVLEYDCIGEWPSNDYDNDGDHPPRWEFLTHFPPYSGFTITVIPGGYHMSYNAYYWGLGGGQFQIGWFTDSAGRWGYRTGAAVRTGIIKNFKINGVDYTPTLTPEVDNGQQLMQIGTPVVYFSSKPYFTINCEVAAKYAISGAQSNAGVVCCANDGQNFIAARATPTKIELVKQRGGIETLLAEASYTWPTDGEAWIKLKLQDGVFNVFVRDVHDDAWHSYSSRYWSDPILTYEWTEANGAMLVDKNISHVGVYALRDAPFIRITGFDPTLGNKIGVAPGSPDISEFPTSGTVRIDGVAYSYTGIDGDLEDGIRGPYQGRNVSGPYTLYGSICNAAEYTHFDWLGNDSGNIWDKYIAVETGFCWGIETVNFQPSIVTKGVTIILKNRMRVFSYEANGDVIGMSTRVWETGVLTGVAKTEGDEVTHIPYSIAFLDSESEIILYEFAASSGHGPLTDRDMIDIVCKLSDARPEFVADNEFDSLDLTATPYEVSD